MRIRSLQLAAFLMIGPSLSAQEVLDGAYIKEHTTTRRALPYVHVREADVFCVKRVWRMLDLKEKMNLPLFYPIEASAGRRSLWAVLRDALEQGYVTAYDAGVLLQDDDLRRPLRADQVDSILNPVQTIWTPSLDDPSVQTPVVVPDPVTSAMITRYQLKEDHVFDKQRGSLDVRIIGLAPMREVRGDDGALRGYAPLFWLYFPELRYVLANAEAFNTSNDGERRSLDHVFQERRFSSWVVKESNVHDRRISDHAAGLDALSESERVKDGLFNREHDLWNH